MAEEAFREVLAKVPDGCRKWNRGTANDGRTRKKSRKAFELARKSGGRTSVLRFRFDCSGNLLNRSELARDVGVSPNTANQWISVLQAANIVFLLEPWFANRNKSLVKSPKLYFADTGLLCFLCGIRETGDLVNSPLKGAIWETLVFSELRKRQTADLGSWDVYFYRERQLEADFLIERGGRYHLIDAKWNPHPKSSDLAALRKVAERLGAENVVGMDIACRSKASFPIDGRSRAISVLDLDM